MICILKIINYIKIVFSFMFSLQKYWIETIDKNLFKILIKFIKTIFVKNDFIIFHSYFC